MTFVCILQVRGSIPLFWQQVPELQYKPTPTVLPGAAHVSQKYHMCVKYTTIATMQLSALQKHYDELISNYGKVVSVSLVSTVIVCNSKYSFKPYLV